MQSKKKRIHRDFSASEREGKREKNKREGRKVVAAVVDCRALTLAGHKAISKFHLF